MTVVLIHMADGNCHTHDLGNAHEISDFDRVQKFVSKEILRGVFVVMTSDPPRWLNTSQIAWIEIKDPHAL